jgi:poly(A) polymerase
MRLDVAKWRQRKGVARILKALDGDAGMTRYVGGAVRDDLLGEPVSDIDFATRIVPDAVVERLERARIKAVPTGITHGTVTAVADGQPAEITTLRADVSTDGRRATVAFTDDWKADASRRDFTINALYADPASGEVFDYFGGLDDLQAGIVRFIGDPLGRIAEDHLRILRFFRFHARYGRGAPNAAAIAACAARANDLMALSRERIADELLKLLAVADPAPTVALMLDHGILAPVIPEIADAAPLAALVAAERDAGLPADPVRRLASLLPADEPVAVGVAARLKLSNKAKARLGRAAARDPIADPAQLAYWIGTESAVDRLLLATQARAAATLAATAIPRLPLKGGDLIAMGLNEGPVVARTLKAIERAWVEAGFPSGAEWDRLVATHVASAGG